MKFLAILKDSVREAIDAKVFLVMLVLSCLVIATVASTRYLPVPLEEKMDEYAHTMTFAFRFSRQKGGVPESVTIRDFEQTNTAAEPWDGDYRFFIVMRYSQKSDAEMMRLGSVFGVDTQLEKGLRHQFPFLNDVHLRSVKSDNPTEVRFEVTTHGGTDAPQRDWPHRLYLFYALPVAIFDRPLPQQVHLIEDTMISGAGAGIALLVSVVVTAFFIPNMMRKGTIDLLLAKPLHRSTLLLHKYVGGLSFMFLITVFIVVGVWLAIGLRTGLWGAGFLLTILVLTFQFAVYYAISTFFAVWTRNAIVAILMCCLAWGVFFIVGMCYRGVEEMRALARGEVPELEDMMGPNAPPAHERTLPKWTEWAFPTVDFLHAVTPRMKDLDVLTTKVLNDDLLPAESRDRKLSNKLYANFRWTEALGVSLLYIGLLLGLSCWRFNRVDF